MLGKLEGNVRRINNVLAVRRDALTVERRKDCFYSRGCTTGHELNDIFFLPLSGRFHSLPHMISISGFTFTVDMVTAFGNSKQTNSVVLSHVTFYFFIFFYSIQNPACFSLTLACLVVYQLFVFKLLFCTWTIHIACFFVESLHWSEGFGVSRDFLTTIIFYYPGSWCLSVRFWGKKGNRKPLR